MGLRNSLHTLAANIGRLPKGKPIEIWFQDEARLGQTHGRTRIWAKKGRRPVCQPTNAIK